MQRIQKDDVQLPLKREYHTLGKKASYWATASKTDSRSGKRHKWLCNFCYLVVASTFVCSSIERIFSSNEWYSSENYKEKTCRHFKPVDPKPDLSNLSSERKARFKAVKRSIAHAWKGYTNIASLDSFWNEKGGFIPHDDLSPVSKKGNSWLHYAATLHDSIDTLYLANMTQEYGQAVDWLTNYDVQTTSPQATKTFEYSLRVLGGLLGSYSISGDARLFAAARNAADAILEGPFQASPTIIPRPFNVLAPSTSLNSFTWRWDWKAGIQRLYKTIYSTARNRFTKEHQINSLAGFGSFGLEFSFLSTVTGDRKYRQLCDEIFHHVNAYERNGIIPASWNVVTGEPIGHHGSLGSGSDSFYEYLIKIPVLNRCYFDAGMEMYTNPCTDTDKEYLKLYEKMVKEALTPFYAKKQSIGVDVNNVQSQHVFPVDFSRTYDHLLCFLPAMLSLGASTKYPVGSKNINDDRDHRLARQLLDGCATIYKSTKTNISPDTGYIDPGRFSTADPSYYLRPEYVESLFVIFRLTKDESLQELAWDVFQSIEKYCKIPSGGYAGLKDVNDPSKGHIDDMPSYFLAETLKYLLLIFGPDDYVSLDEFVFTTEAHPLRKLKELEPEYSEDSVPFCVLDSRPPTPIPWTLLCIATGIIVVYVGVFLVIWNFARKVAIAFLDHKAKTS